MKKPTKTQYAGSVFIVIAACLWALDGILRRSLYSLPPLTIVFYEHVVGLVILAGVLFASHQLKHRRDTNVSTQAWWQFSLSSHKLGAAVGLLSGLIGTVAFTAALQQVGFIPFSVVLLLQKLTPIFAGAVAIIILKERVTRQYLIWALGSIIAAYFVTFPNGVVSLTAGQGQLIAAGLAILAAASWGSSTTLSKLLLLRESTNRAAALRFSWTIMWGLLAGILLALVAGWQGIAAGASAAISWSTVITTFSHYFSVPTTNQLLTLMTIALSTGMVALLLYYRGLRQVPVLIATILELVFPLLAVFIDVVLYNTVLLPSQYLAALVMIFCVYMTDHSRVIAPEQSA